ncbi:hypothetical protein BGX21_010502 [Mortierella sp. AD011]|nr:hypothetical protein BGX20_011401 [Mortierella sp. AD010]KAF9394077.1 hypothetical protein BGX21_010502 [Mortierella sp. AD011]
MFVATGSANNHSFETSFEIQSILASESASLEASMTKEQILAIGNHLSQNNVRLIHLSLDQSFKDLQEAVVEFLGLPCCSGLQVLEYKAGGSSFGQILLSPSTAPTINIASEQLQDEAFIHARIPFAKTLTTLRLGYNSDAAQSKSDIGILNTVLKRFPQLQEFSMSSPLDDLSLLVGLKPTGLKKLSVTINSEAGLDGKEAENKVREELRKGLGEAEQQVEIEIEINERSSSYYLNMSRDRHFQAFIRRFGGERRQ